MPYQVFETTVFNRQLAAEARMLFVPASVVQEFHLVRADSVLGVRLGVPIPDPDGLVDVLYASLAGRTYSFDSGSFERWRPRWSDDDSEQSLFAQELVFGERTPVSNSPLRAESMAKLAERGQAFVVDGAQWAFSHPLQGLGIIVLAHGSLLIAGVGRAVRETVVIAAKYHLRRLMGIPEDWLPPEDRD